MKTLRLTAALLAPPLVAGAGDDPIPPRADAESFDAIVEHVLPDESELAWSDIPWRPSLSMGMRDGARLEKPVLLWAMNGHPLGST